MRSWILVILLLVTMGPAVASGHALIIDHGVEAIYIEAYYGGVTPIPAQDVDVKVFYPDGSLYIEGKTDENGKFSFDPKHGGEWQVVAESAGHRAEKIVTTTGACESGSAMPLYLRVFAGMGYIIGILGLFFWYKGYKQARQSKKR